MSSEVSQISQKSSLLFVLEAGSAAAVEAEPSEDVLVGKEVKNARRAKNPRKRLKQVFQCRILGP